MDIGTLIGSVEWSFVLIVIGMVALFVAIVAGAGILIEKTADHYEAPKARD